MSDAQDVVDGLVGDGVQPGAGGADERLGVGVRMGVHRVEHGQARTGHPQTRGTQVAFELHRVGHAPILSRSLDRVKI